MRRRKQHAPIAGQKIAAGRSPLPRADQTNRTAPQRHHIFLITVPPVPGGLKDQGCAVKGEVRLGILPALSELADVAQMALQLELRRDNVGGFRTESHQESTSE